MKPRRPAWAWLFFAQLAMVVTATVLATTGHFPTGAFQRAPADKVGHLCAYGGLAFFGVALFGRSRRARVVVSLLVAATLEELSQRAFPARTFDLGDLAMNLIGILAFGALAARLVDRLYMLAPADPPPKAPPPVTPGTAGRAPARRTCGNCRHRAAFAAPHRRPPGQP